MHTRFESEWTRRRFIKTLSSAAVTLYLQGCSSLPSRSLASSPSTDEDFLTNFGPIDRTLGDKMGEFYSGDSFERPHQILWDIPGYLASHPLPEVEERVPVVIVGGGGSGLFSAYNLADLKPVVLEQAPRLGGNAKGQSWKGIDYALGSAYIDHPHPGTAMRRYYDELNWKEILVERTGSDPVEWNGKTYSAFWEGETEPELRKQYSTLSKFFQDLCLEKKGMVFPSIPALNAAERKSVREYDRFDLHTLLSKKVGGKLAPRLETAIEHFCWSTYAGSARELSAAAALNFLAQEYFPIAAAPGGNARLLERLMERLLKKVPASNFRTGAVVLQVKVESDGVRILYEDSKKKLRAIRAQSVVMACPKFVAKRILVDMEPEREQAITKIRYRSYMTANLLLKKKVSTRFYDLFMVGSGKTDLDNVMEVSEKQNATDFVLADFAAPQGAGSVLTFYRAFPYDNARVRLLQPSSYETYRKRFEAQIETSILPMLGLKNQDVVDLRLTRWGHALPLCETGLYSDQTVDKLRAPFREKVFFVEQDNWAYPSLQTGGTEADYWASRIRRTLV